MVPRQDWIIQIYWGLKNINILLKKSSTGEDAGGHPTRDLIFNNK